MRKFIEKNDLLDSSHYGFRKVHSTEHPFLDIVNVIQSNTLNLILNKRTVRSNRFAIYKTTSMLCACLGVLCENVVKQTMQLITCNALVRVSHRMVSFSEFVHFNFHPHSDLDFLLRGFLLTEGEV